MEGIVLEGIDIRTIVRQELEAEASGEIQKLRTEAAVLKAEVEGQRNLNEALLELAQTYHKAFLRAIRSTPTL